MINKWLEQFKEGWVSKDLGLIGELFSEDVEYWETPFRKLEGVDAVIDEWQGILDQSDISIDTSVVAQDDNLYIIRWHLGYQKSDGQEHKWAGLYLVRLSPDSRCTYFYQVGERGY